MADNPARMCVCGHDELTHSASAVSFRLTIDECFASLPAAPGFELWECGCPEFAEAKTATEIHVAQERTRAGLLEGAARAQLRAAFGNE